MSEKQSAIVVGAYTGLLIAASTVVLAGGAFMWSYAIAAAHRARLHSIQADVSVKTMAEADAAIDEVQDRQPVEQEYRRPTRRDFEDMLLAERPGNGLHRDEYTTEANENIPPTAPMEVGGRGDMFAEPSG